MIRMKYFMALCALFLGVQVASAEYYVLNDPTEREIGTIGNGPELKLSGAGHQVTFEAKRSFAAVTGHFFLQQKINGSWKDVNKDGLSLSRDYKTYGPYTISPDATHVRCITKTGATLTKYYKNVKVTMAAVLKTDKSSIDFGATELNKNKQQVFVVEHQNVNTLKVSSSNNMVFTPAITTIAASGPGKKGKQVIVVTFNAKSIGVYSGKITVGNGTQTVTVDVKGEVLRKAQTLTWRNDISVVPEGLYVDGAATASSGLEVTYVSDNEAAVRVEGDSLIAVAAGTAMITAIQAGNEEWAEVSDSLRMEVTTKEVQTITWEQDFYKLKLGDAPVTLNATATSGLEMTYVSGNDAVVRVDGNVLSVIGVGETIITATQAGDATWAGASLEHPVRVREVSAGCDEYALYNPGKFDLGASGSKTIDLPRPGAKLSYRLYLAGSATGELWVYSVMPDGSRKEAQHIGSLYGVADTFSGKHVSYSDINIDPKAVKVHFDVSGTLTKEIDQIYLTQATFLETSAANVAFGNVQVGVDYAKSLVVNHSNLTDIVEVAWRKGDVFTLDGATDFGSGCGSYGSEELTIGITPDTVGEMIDTLVVLSVDRVLEIPVSASVQKKTQAIDWNQDLSTLVIDDTLALAATASSGLAVTYTSSDESVAVIDEENNLAFVAPGTAIITASQEGDAEYMAAQSMEKEVTVTKIVPTVTELPSASGITYGETLESSILTGGKATASGTFSWIDATEQPAAGAEQVFEVLFMADNTAFYDMAIVEVPVNVARAEQTITWEQDLFLLTEGDTVTLTAQSSGGLTIMYETRGENILIQGDKLIAQSAGAGTIMATQLGDDNYMSAEMVTLSYSVISAGVEITTFPTASDITYGQSLAYSLLEGGEATVEGEFAWVDASIVPNAGQEQSFEASFTAEGEEPVVFTVKVNVAKAEQVITWEQELDELIVGGEVLLTATTSSALVVEYESKDSTIAKIEGNMLMALAAGETKILAKQSGNENYLPASSVAIYVYVKLPSGFDDVEAPQVAMYPNPAVDYVRVHTQGGEAITVYNEHGQMISTHVGEGAETQINVQGLPAGKYIIVVRQGTTSGSAVLMKR